MHVLLATHIYYGILSHQSSFKIIKRDMHSINKTNIKLLSLFMICIIGSMNKALATEQNFPDNSHTQFVNVIHYDQYRGLLGKKVTQIDQDTLGYMWFATQQGLNRFDSQNFTHFTQDSLNPDSLPSNEISLFVQTEQDMWLSLNNIGLARYQKAQQKFTLFPEVDSNGEDRHQGIFQSVVFALAADRDDNIWVFQFDGGISIFNQKTQAFSHLTPDNTDWLKSVRFFDAKTAPNGHIWAVTLEGIVYDINPTTQQAEIHRIEVNGDPDKEARIYGISLTEQGDIYLAAYQGVYRFDSQQNTFTHIINRNHLSQLMGEPLTVRNITADSANRLWLATVKGLVLFNQGLLSRIQFINQGKVLEGHLNIRSVYEDMEKNIWIATDKKGVLRLNHRWHQTTIKRPASSTANMQLETGIHAAGNFEDNLWLYDNQQHAVTLNRYKNGQFSTLKTYDKHNNLPDQINGIYVDENFQLWVFSVMGLYRLNPASNEFELLSDLTGIRFVFEINQRLFFTLYSDNTLYRWSEQEEKALPIKSHNLLSEIQTDLRTDDKGMIWLVGNKGLEVINSQTLKTQYQIQTHQGFSGIALENDRVWLLSNGKILRYQVQDGAFIQESTSQLNQLISTEGIYRFKLINDQLWLLGQAGVVVIDSTDNNLINRYTNTDSLPGQKTINIFKMHDDSIMIVSDNGLVHIQDQVVTNSAGVNPPLVLKQLRHNGQSLQNVSELPYNYGSLQIDYQLLSFSQSDSHRYQYRLSPEQNWLDAGQQTSQNFYQLPANNYQLQIRGKTLDRDWSDPLQIDFAVAKAPWKTPIAYWIYGLFSLLFVLITFFIWRKRWHYNQELKNAHEKQAFVENQLSLTSSLVQSLDVDELFAKIKQQLGQHIQCSDIEICYWNTDNNDQIFSDDKLTVSEQNRLGSLALRMYEADQKYQLESDDRGHFLHVLFSHSKNRLGLITFYRKSEPFKDNTISLAIAYVAQSSLAIENARLFQAVQHLAEQAKTSSKAKSDFLAQVSHEIRTPMNGILGMNQLLLESPLNDDQRLYAQAVNESGEHLLDIINDILDLSKIEAGKLVLEEKPFNLVELIDEITQSFVPVSKNKRLSFVTCLDADLPAHWLGDATRIKQIMINLLSNAFKFTHKGEVLLSVQPAHDPDELLIVVRDTGMGIEQSMINNLFDPFAQADSSITRKYGGTGLGLSIVKQLCEKMSGDINIDSQTGRGTEVSCLIKANLNPSVTSTPQSRNTTACLMADDSAVKSALTECLLRLGMTVSYDFEEPFDYLFVIDHKQTAYNHAIEIAQREFKPVYLLKSQLQNNPHHQGSFKVLNWPFLHKQIADLFSLSQELESNDTTATSSGKTLHLLVLEDNVINQQLLLELLEKAGHVVDLFDDPHQALNAIDNTHYDALLVDYHLPGMTGIDFVLACRELGIRSTTVMMSADISNELKQRCQQHSIDNLLIKPFKIDVLMQILNQD